MKLLFHPVLLILVLLLGVAACTTREEAVPITFGKDQCAYCKMTISNPKFGAELITDKGRVLKYDAAECMVNHLKEDAPKFQKLYVVPYDKPKELRAVEDLLFLVSPDFRSPMGANLAAFSDTTALGQKYQEQFLNWQTLLKSL